MKLDDTILRDLNRIVNDRDVSQQHRNVASRAITLFTNIEGFEEPEVTEPPADAATLREREDEYLKVMGIEL
jgi:hypothetical protein